MNEIRVIHPDAFLDAIKHVENGEFGELSATNYEVHAFDTIPTPGYDAPSNFPECCDYHKKAYSMATQYLAKFPECCIKHSKLTTAHWFKKTQYEKVPIRILKALHHTEHNTTQKINHSDWYEDITEYIDYCIASFGSLPLGYGNPVGIDIYYNYTRFYIEQNKSIPDEKKQKLLTYLDGLTTIEQPAEQTDLNTLNDLYKKWLNAFPFDISFFQNSKESFEKSLPPLLSNKPAYNRYLKISKGKLITCKQLVEFLFELTKQMLLTVDSVKIAKEAPISDINKKTIELLNESLRLQNNLLFGKYSKGEMKYLQVLKKWLEYQKNYFRDITPYLKKVTETTPKGKNDIDTTINELKKKENLFWKGVPMSRVIDHFIVFTERNSKNGKPFLTKEQFIQFIQRGFLSCNEIPKQTLNLSNGEKGFVIKRFYEFFDLSVSQFGELNKKFKYINLIDNCFDNWNKKGIEAFFKPSKTKQSW